MVSHTLMRSRVAQRARARHLCARGVTTVPGSIPGCITSGHDLESHKGGAQLAQRRLGWSGVGRHCDKNGLLTDLPS